MKNSPETLEENYENDEITLQEIVMNRSKSPTAPVSVDQQSHSIGSSAEIPSNEIIVDDISDEEEQDGIKKEDLVNEIEQLEMSDNNDQQESEDNDNDRDGSSLDDDENETALSDGNEGVGEVEQEEEQVETEHLNRQQQHEGKDPYGWNNYSLFADIPAQDNQQVFQDRIHPSDRESADTEEINADEYDSNQEDGTDPEEMDEEFEEYDDNELRNVPERLEYDSEEVQDEGIVHYRASLEEDKSEEESQNESEEEFYEEENQMEQELMEGEPLGMVEPESPAVRSRPLDQSFISLETFRTDATVEERELRNQKLKEGGHFITQEAWNEFEFSDYTPFEQNVLRRLQEKEISIRKQMKRLQSTSSEEELNNTKPTKQPKLDKELAAGLTQQTKETAENDECTSMTGSQQEELIMMSEFDVGSSEPEEATPTVSETIVHQSVETAIAPVKIETITKAMAAQNTETSSTNTETPPATTVLDSILTKILQKKSSQRITRSSAGEPSDLEFVANFVSATNDSESNKPTEKKSQFTKKQHMDFQQINKKIKQNMPLTPEEHNTYRSMTIPLRAEKDQFIKDQCDKTCASGVYAILDDKVSKTLEPYFQMEHARIKSYPQHYKYFNILNMPTAEKLSEERHILSFNKALLKTGQIAFCKPEMMESARKMDLFKHYLDYAREEEANDDASYYKKKTPPAVSKDPVISSLLKDTKANVVISIDSLVEIVELVNDVNSEMYMPITVKEENNVKTMMFDSSLLKRTMTARERNQLVYNSAFKSLCLDWPKRHSVTGNSSGATSTLYEKPVKTTNEGDFQDAWDSEKDENLQYNLWSIGEVNILTRHQVDGDLVGQSKRETRNVCLLAKLDYQISEGRDEIFTPKERAGYWIKSYIAGHATVIEGRIDMVKNRLVRVDKKKMLDIMEDRWQPLLESEMLHVLFSTLQKTLLPGNYILRHKKGDRNFLVYQSSSNSNSSNNNSNSSSTSTIDMNLWTTLATDSTTPELGNAETCFIPAWKSDDENQIKWTFSPR